MGAKRTDIGPDRSRSYEFAVSGAGEDYIDLFNNYFFVEAHIVNIDGSDIDADTDVGTVHLWMHSLFSDVNVSLSEKLVSPPTGMYPYRAYMLDLPLPAQSVHITTKVVSSNLVHGEVQSLQHYVT